MMATCSPIIMASMAMKNQFRWMPTKLIVETPAVELVEDLHPDEGVEDYGVEVEFLRGDGGVAVEDAVAREVEDEDHG
jgi:hypothetical protein